MKTAAEIAELAVEQRKLAGPVHARRVKARDMYGGDIAVPLPELHVNEQAAIINLYQKAVDATSQRVASTKPDIRWAPVRPGIKKHEDAARRKRQVAYGWWEKTSMELVDLRRARHLTAYAESPVEIRWDRKHLCPYWQVRDPLDTYTAPSRRVDEMDPTWVIYCYTRNLGWIRRTYPDAFAALNIRDKHDRTVVELVEYQDGEETVVVAVGAKREPWEMGYADQRATAVELERVPNRVGRTLSVVPGRIGLTDQLHGQFDGMIPKYLRMARLDALQMIAIEEGIFPKMYLVGRQGETPKIITHAEPRKGIPGMVSGGDLQPITLNPGYKTDAALATLERGQMVEGDLPASFLGESVRGGRSALMTSALESAAVDFGIAETQKILARSKQVELELAAELAKSYAGNVTVSLYVSDKSAKGVVSYQAKELFETVDVTVRYPMPGADYNELIQRNSMKLANRIISEQTAREMDPEVEDAELERDRITVQELEKAVLSGLQAKAAAGEPGVLDQLLRIAEQVITDKRELLEAAVNVNEEVKEQQAAPPMMGPEGDPNAMPGLGAPPAAPTGPPGLEQLLAAASGGM